jgi:hypothetical protein
MCAAAPDEVLWRTPITGIALAASGQPATAPPSSVMNERRFISAPSWPTFNSQDDSTLGRSCGGAAHWPSLWADVIECLLATSRVEWLRDSGGGKRGPLIRLQLPEW